MLNYILRRLLLVIPTLVGIMVVNFALVQFVPGGPVEQMIARLEGGGDVFGGFAGAANDAGAESVGQAESQYLKRARVAARIHRGAGTGVRLRQAAA